MNYDRSVSVFSKIWFYLVLAVVLLVSVFVSVFIFFAVLVVIALTVPYVLYLQWKARKAVEDIDIKTKVRKQLKEL
ncbi:hypothetical protein [Persephonella sp.]